MVETIKGLADELCGGRLVFTLEGGYNLNALATSVRATFDTLLDKSVEDSLGPPRHNQGTADIDCLIETVKKIHQLP